MSTSGVGFINCAVTFPLQPRSPYFSQLLCQKTFSTLRTSAFTSRVLLNNKQHTPSSSSSSSHESYTQKAQLGNDDDVLETAPNGETTIIPELEALDPASGSVIISPTFYLAASFLFVGGLLCYLGDGYVIIGLPFTLLGTLLAVQTFSVRFIFGPKRLSVARRSFGGKLTIIRGWEFEQITNWEVWWKKLPTLAYFKESESYEGRGSPHFFPMVCNGAELIEQLRKRTPHLDKSNYDD